MNDIVIVVTGAAPLPRRAIETIPTGAILIAADGALDHALAAGLEPAALVGDLDSVSPEGLEWAEAHSTIQRHPPDKDHTDTELALATAADLNPRRLMLISGGGDRLDHTFAAIGAPGTTLSLLALHGPCSGVTIGGVVWPLDRADLGPTVGLGVSNESAADVVDVSVNAGVLTIFINPPTPDTTEAT